jgi:para-nitrobenzyl esterase
MLAEAAKYYSASSDAAASDVGKAMSRDRSRGYAYEWAKRRAPKSRFPIYIYQFIHPHPGPTMARYGAFHTSEVPYVFRNLDAPRPWTDADRKISDDLSARWISFISGGAPDTPGAPKWPVYRTADPKLMMLGDEDKAEDLLSLDKRRMFDAIVEGGGKIARY